MYTVVWGHKELMAHFAKSNNQHPFLHLMHSTASSNPTPPSLSILTTEIDTIYLLSSSYIPLGPLQFFPGKSPFMPFEMASIPKFSYQRLVHEGGSDDDYDDLREKVIGRGRNNWSRSRKVHTRKRLKVRIPRLGRFLRRKARLVVLSWAKVVKRLKDSHSHFGDLFAGNYMFMQVTPTPLRSVQNSLKGHDSNGLSSRYSLPRIAS